jgi:Uma2 family endonuclease
VAVSDAAIDAGRVRLVPASGGRPDRFTELEGAPDLVVEIVSDASVTKDTQRLPAAYHAAGIPEFWLIDARGADVRFTIHRHEPSGYVASVTTDGHAFSTLFNRGFTLVRGRNASGRFVYDLAAVG